MGMENCRKVSTPGVMTPSKEEIQNVLNGLKAKLTEQENVEKMDPPWRERSNHQGAAAPRAETGATRHSET